jgi:hypothetical protein
VVAGGIGVAPGAGAVGFGGGLGGCEGANGVVRA